MVSKTQTLSIFKLCRYLSAKKITGIFSHISERLSAEAERLFEDVEEDFSQISGVKSRFERWRNEQGESYHEAYIGLCLPKLFTPFVKLKLIQWNPLEVRMNVSVQTGHKTWCSGVT